MDVVRRSHRPTKSETIAEMMSQPKIPKALEMSLMEQKAHAPWGRYEMKGRLSTDSRVP